MVIRLCSTHHSRHSESGCTTNSLEAIQDLRQVLCFVVIVLQQCQEGKTASALNRFDFEPDIIAKDRKWDI
jgi:hypothetical protein